MGDLRQALRSPFDLVLCLLPLHMQQAADVVFAVRWHSHLLPNPNPT